MSATRMMILGLVQWMQPVHGYDVRRELLSSSADKWSNIQPGSIYHALRQLSAEELRAGVEQLRAAQRSDWATAKPTNVSWMWELTVDRSEAEIAWCERTARRIEADGPYLPGRPAAGWPDR